MNLNDIYTCASLTILAYNGAAEVDDSVDEINFHWIALLKQTYTLLVLVENVFCAKYINFWKNDLFLIVFHCDSENDLKNILPFGSHGKSLIIHIGMVVVAAVMVWWHWRQWVVVWEVVW